MDKQTCILYDITIIFYWCTIDVIVTLLTVIDMVMQFSYGSALSTHRLISLSTEKAQSMHGLVTVPYSRGPAMATAHRTAAGSSTAAVYSCGPTAGMVSREQYSVVRTWLVANAQSTFEGYNRAENFHEGCMS